MIVGLTGGIASGKSTVARMLKEQGAIVLDADAQVRANQIIGSDGYEKTRTIVGEDCVLENGAFDREKIRSKILKNPTILDALEDNLHPVVRNYYAKALKGLDTKNDLIILDVPLLIGYPTEPLCEKIVVTICADEDERKKRAFDRGGMSEDWWQFITSRQLTADQFRKRADYVIPTECSMNETKEHVQKLISLLTNTKA